MDRPDEANSRARSNAEGPNNAAPGARLTDGLTNQGTPTSAGNHSPIFSPEGQWGLTGKASALTTPSSSTRLRSHAHRLPLTSDGDGFLETVPADPGHARCADG